MLNWRRDPDYERRMSQLRREIEQLRIENRRRAVILSNFDAAWSNSSFSKLTPPTPSSPMPPTESGSPHC